MTTKYIDCEQAQQLLIDDNDFSAAELLDHLPAADVVEVVRCRDCMYCDTMNWSGQTAFECEHPLGLIDASPNNYCVFGERK